MSSNSAFMSAGELHCVSPVLQGGHIGNLQLCCRPQLDGKRIQSAGLEGDRRGDQGFHIRKWASAREKPALYSPAKRRSQPFYHQAPAAVLREGAEQASTADSTACRSEGNSNAQRANRELNALDAYFSKLQGNPRGEQASPTPIPVPQVVSLSPDQGHASTGKSFPAVQTQSDASTSSDPRQEEKSRANDLRSVEAYFHKLGRGANFKQPPGSNKAQESERELEDLLKEISPSLNMASLYESLEAIEELDSEALTGSSGSESYMVYLLVAVNIAVYLFGLASPVETAGMGSSTLPLLYGAKVNELILDGQWWRLITPMFLHSGFLHVALSSWALLFFGPQVEIVYGSLAFCMLYFLGGFCGNILSFFYTPAATVGGTGPFFAILISWVVYLVQNRKELGERSADYGIKMTASLGVLIICLSCLLPIDEWIHVGAVLPGALFGAFTCPSVQISVDQNDTPAKNRDTAEGVYGVYEGPGPLKVTLAFSVFIAVCLGLFSFFAPMVAAESQLLEGGSLLF